MYALAPRLPDRPDNLEVPQYLVNISRKPYSRLSRRAAHLTMKLRIQVGFSAPAGSCANPIPARAVAHSLHMMHMT